MMPVMITVTDNDEWMWLPPQSEEKLKLLIMWKNA
jgi:hypothetical protein